MDMLTKVLLNRIVIALVSAVGAFIVGQWPKVHETFCAVVPGLN
jgi:hypothetical protein